MAAFHTGDMCVSALLEVHGPQTQPPILQAMRTARKSLQIPEIDKDSSTFRARKRKLNAAFNVGEIARPVESLVANASMAPFPARVGIRETTVAPQENAPSTDSVSHRSCSQRGNERRRNQQEDAQSNFATAKCRCRRGKLLERQALVQSLERVRVAFPAPSQLRVGSAGTW